ncbi:MAG TPA: dethiobiotin synthase [Gammaproteobacteria bacterium]|nr:dethiobiotin synthase [Gammaproteobacteria bacterium]
MDLFITAAGTEIGKTYVAERLIAECRSRGISCDAVKPVVTGFDSTPQSDTARLLTALGVPTTAATVAACSPWRFAAALAPNMAAAREDRRLGVNEIVDFCKRSSDSRLRLIEGIGGVMVPLNEHETVLDWIAALGAPALLVAGSYLGAISHALTAYEALRSRALAVHAIVVDQSRDEPVPLEETRATIAAFTTPTPVVSLARDGAVAGSGLPAGSLLEALQLVAPGP